MFFWFTRSMLGTGPCPMTSCFTRLVCNSIKVNEKNFSSLRLYIYQYICTSLHKPQAVASSSLWYVDINHRLWHRHLLCGEAGKMALNVFVVGQWQVWWTSCGEKGCLRAQTWGSKSSKRRRSMASRAAPQAQPPATYPHTHQSSLMSLWYRFIHFLSFLTLLGILLFLRSRSVSQFLSILSIRFMLFVCLPEFVSRC